MLKPKRKATIALLCLAFMPGLFADFPVTVCTRESWSEEITTVSGYYTEGTETHAPAWVTTTTTTIVDHPAQYSTVSVEGSPPSGISAPDSGTIDQTEDTLEAAAVPDAIVRDTPQAVAERIADNSVASAAVVVQAKETQQAAFSSSAGDPVLVTTGAFTIVGEEDFSLLSGKTAADITRTYVSSRDISHSLGKGWGLSIDSRIISGMNFNAAELYAEARAKYDVASGICRSKKDYIDRFNIRAALTEAERIIGTLNTTIGSLESYSWSECRSMAADARLKRETWIRYAAILQAILDSYATAVNTLAFLEPVIEALRTEAEWTADNASRNTFSLDPANPADFARTGNRTLLWIDRTGLPHLYEIDAAPDMHSSLRFPEGSATTPFSPHDPDLVVMPDGSYKLTEPNGTVCLYSYHGLPESVTDTNGRVFSFRYSSDGLLQSIGDDRQREILFEHAGRKITKIRDPINRYVEYAYNNQGLLSAVTDIEGDTVQYDYADGVLAKIVKPDGSFIRVEYGFTGADGKKLTTSTTHEEGASEKIDYFPDQKRTVHTDHSGVTTNYWYDDFHRTVKEEHADGTVRTFQYNPVTGDLDAETLNGSTISYTYSPRGKRESARYDDGSVESWLWNELDESTRYRDRDGIETSWAYDSNGNCTNILRDGIQVFACTYDGEGLPVSEKTGDRESVHYSYDEHGYLATKTTGSGGAAVTEFWTNDAIGRITSHVDGEGRKTTWQYTGRNVTETGPSGLERTREYNNRKDLVTVTEKDLVTEETRVTKIAYDKRHLPVKITDGDGRVTEYAYREDGKLISGTTGKWKTSYRYDTAGRLSETVKTMEGSTEVHTERHEYSRGPSGESETLIEPAGKSSVYRYDEWNRMTQVVNALGEISERQVSPAGRTVREQTASGGMFAFQYDASGQLTGIGKEHETAQEVTWLSDGNIATKTDRNGSTTTYAYDDKGLLVLESSISGSKAYTYDAAGRVTAQVTSTKNPEEPGTGTYSTSWAYASDGRSVTVTEGGLYPVVWSLNAWGEVVRKTDGEGNSYTRTFDKNGKVSAEIDGYGRTTKYTWNAIGKVDTITSADGSVETYGYNHLGLLNRIDDALGTSWSLTYDAAGRLVRETGRPGIDKEYEYDVLDRLTTVKSGGMTTESLRYDNRGRTITSIDGNDNSFVYEKDAFGVVTGETNRFGDSRSFGYDGEERITGTREFSGKVVNTGYDDDSGSITTGYTDGSGTVIVTDASGRITHATGGTGTIRYRYDEGGLLASQYDERAGEETRYTYDHAGRRIRMASGNREVSYRYGKNGELIGIEDNKQLKAAFAYDVMGREALRTYGNGIVQETKYDAIGRIILIRELSARGELLRAEGYLYDEAGRRSHSIDENGKVTVYSYDSRSRLESVLYPLSPEQTAASKAEADRAGLSFTADKGNPGWYLFPPEAMPALQALLDLMSPFRGNMLQPSQNVWTESFTYDANGNRRTKTTPWGTIAYAYDAENRLVSMGDISYTYDRDGNLIGEKGLRKTAVYGYTDTNRMNTSIVTDTTEKSRTTTQYAYDAFGRRTLSATGDEAMRTLYDGLSFDVLRSSPTFPDGAFTSNYSGGMPGAPGASTSPTRYRWIGDSTDDDRYRPIDADGFESLSARFSGTQTPLYANGESIAMNRNDRTAYFGTDLIGSVRSATDAYGTPESRYDYDVFGQPWQGDFKTGLNVGYTGKPYDPVTTMYDYGYRDYSPVTARFTTIDPIRDGNNWYAYVNNDPVNWVDDFGLSASDIKKSLSINEIRKKNLEFAGAMRDIVGTPYVLGGTSKKGVDCSGTIGLALASMGYKNVPDYKALEMAAGKAPYIIINKVTNSENQGSTGMVNFYTWDEENGVEHLNVGVGKKVNESKTQVVDATSGGWMTSRNGHADQYIPAKKNTVNKTYSAYSSNTKPASQGQLNWSVLEAYK